LFIERAGSYGPLAAQFLANIPVPKNRETYGRELAVFPSSYGEDGSMANATFEDLLTYKVMSEKGALPRHRDEEDSCPTEASFDLDKLPEDVYASWCGPNQ